MAWARPSLPDRETRLAERAVRNAAQAQTCLPRRAAVMVGGTVGPAPKPVPWRCPTLLDMARNRPCLLLVPGSAITAPPNPTLALAVAILAAQEKAERKAKKPEPAPEPVKKKARRK